MCGRFGFAIPAAQAVEHFALETAPALPPRHNIAPTQDVAAVMVHPQTKARVLRFLRWGLIPSWAKDAKIGNRLINARAESVPQTSAFRAAYARRRCLVAADGFYEWEKRADGSKQPWFIRPEGGGPMAFAGLWEHWHNTGPEGGDIFSCTIITTTANELVSPIHHRMPVILPRELYGHWLDPQKGGVDLLTACSLDSDAQLLAPCPSHHLEAWPVSPRVNSPKNDDPQLRERVAEDAAKPATQPSLPLLLDL